MLKAMIIGNLTKNPELRATQSGVPVCSFTVAVNRRNQDAGKQEADFVRVTTWRGLAESCSRFLAKGRKVGVTGTLTLQSYTGNDGQTRYSLEVQADEVEFLTPRSDADDTGMTYDPPPGFTPVDDSSELPF